MIPAASIRTMDDLTRLGSAKLGVSNKMTVVLESDGTEVEDDAILDAVKGEVLLLLQEGECWTPRAVTLKVETGQPPLQEPAPVQPRTPSPAVASDHEPVSSGSIGTSSPDVPDDEVEKELRCGKLAPPRLVIFKSEGCIKGQYVVADGTYINVNSCSEKAGVLLLVAVYYILDLEYPRVYSQLLGILQTHLVDIQPYTGIKSVRSPPHIHKLKELEEGILDIAQNIELKNINEPFQQRLYSDINAPVTSRRVNNYW
ncbi:hypothetical protein ScPMuIL_002724 [Solemya velum]